MFNNQQASLASESNCHIEFNINELLDLGPELLAEGVKQWDKEIWNAKRKNIPIIVSSGASTLNRMREPRALSAIMDLVDVIEEESLDMVSVIPLEMVRKNREKLDSSFVSPGVWRVT
jgi:RNase P/RNase MRP subunit p30